MRQIKKIVIVLSVLMLSFNYAFSQSGKYSYFYFNANVEDTYVTNGLEYYWNDNDLPAGTVSIWNDRIKSSGLAASGLDMEKDNDGVIFTGSGKLVSEDALEIDNEYTIEILYKIERALPGQFIIAYNSSVSIALQTFTDFTSDGLTSGFSGMVALLNFPFTSFETEFAHYVIRANSVSLDIWINNTLVASTTSSTPLLNDADPGTLMVGGDALNTMPATGRVQLIRIYNKLLSPAEISQNYHSYSISSVLNSGEDK